MTNLSDMSRESDDEDETELPPCRCGKANWERRGQSFASNFSSCSYTCMTCGRHGFEIADQGGNLFAVGDPRRAVNEWLAGPVDATWAVRADEIEAVRSAHNKRLKEQIVAELGFDAAKEPMDTQRQKDWAAAWDAADTAKPLELPEPLLDAPMLPGAPVGLHAFVRRRDAWVKIDPLVSIAMPVPAHPTRVRNQKFFHDLFSELSRVTGTILEPEETRNEYSGNRHMPWYRFAAGGVEFVVGRRSKVYELRCDPDNPQVASIWSELASRDAVTFSGKGPLLIHAWTQAKTLEYLTSAMSLACQPSP